MTCPHHSPDANGLMPRCTVCGPYRPLLHAAYEYTLAHGHGLAELRQLLRDCGYRPRLRRAGNVVRLADARRRA